MKENNYNARVDEMPTFEEYAERREAEYIKAVGEDYDEAHYSDPAQAKRQRLLNYEFEYSLEYAVRLQSAEAAEDEAARLTREYNEKMAALGAKHHIERSNADKAILNMLSSMFE